jgi:hypothetical protein
MILCVRSSSIVVLTKKGVSPKKNMNSKFTTNQKVCTPGLGYTRAA